MTKTQKENEACIVPERKRLCGRPAYIFVEFVNVWMPVCKECFKVLKAEEAAEEEYEGLSDDEIH